MNDTSSSEIVFHLIVKISCFFLGGRFNWRRCCRCCLRCGRRRRRRGCFRGWSGSGSWRSISRWRWSRCSFCWWCRRRSTFCGRRRRCTFCGRRCWGPFRGCSGSGGTFCGGSSRGALCRWGSLRGGSGGSFSRGRTFRRGRTLRRGRSVRRGTFTFLVCNAMKLNLNLWVSA
ncbi:unnamed protein product [Chrysodeixis includens]|uniref:Uncharacterized protein n=1 Tax=Chrysodeixis includens TaxID=689277 RepID=A0A9N8KU34_CHRIL|nr:unnamed protein product [Chrysodeixis includens]